MNRFIVRLYRILTNNGTEIRSDLQVEVRAEDEDHAACKAEDANHGWKADKVNRGTKQESEA